MRVCQKKMWTAPGPPITSHHDAWPFKLRDCEWTKDLGARLLQAASKMHPCSDMFVERLRSTFYPVYEMLVNFEADASYYKPAYSNHSTRVSINRQLTALMFTPTYFSPIIKNSTPEQEASRLVFHECITYLNTWPAMAYRLFEEIPTDRSLSELTRQLSWHCTLIPANHVLMRIPCVQTFLAAHSNVSFPAELLMSSLLHNRRILHKQQQWLAEVDNPNFLAFLAGDIGACDIYPDLMVQAGLHTDAVSLPSAAELLQQYMLVKPKEVTSERFIMLQHEYDTLSAENAKLKRQTLGKNANKRRFSALIEANPNKRRFNALIEENALQAAKLEEMEAQLTLERHKSTHVIHQPTVTRYLEMWLDTAPAKVSRSLYHKWVETNKINPIAKFTGRQFTFADAMQAKGYIKSHHNGTAGFMYIRSQ